MTFSHAYEERRAEEPIELRPLPWPGLGLMVLIAVVAGAVVIGGFDRISDPMPVHWGARGEADNWAGKSLLGALSIALVGPVILTVITWVVTVVTRTQAEQAGKGFPRMTVHQVNRARLMANELNPVLPRWFAVLSALIAADLTLSLLGLPALPGAGLFLAIMGWVVLFLVRVAGVQRAVDARFPRPESAHMKWGLVYYNPDDPRVMIEENGMNATMNFARPAAWAILAGLLVPSVLIVTLLAVFG